MPYALGGTLTITEGSSESCRTKTHAFETYVLTGPMRMIRYIQNLPSSTKHRSVPKTVELFVKPGDDTEQRIELPIAKTPILLAFYEFGEASTWIHHGVRTSKPVASSLLADKTRRSCSWLW